MTPAGPATSQPEEAAPPLPPRPRPRRRPVPTPGAAASQSPASPTQVPQFRELGSYPSSPSRSPPTYDPSRPDHGYAPIPAVPAQGAASAGSPGVQPTRRHSRFGSAVRKLAKVVFLESISPGLSAALASDNPAVPDPNQPASSPRIQPGQVVVNGVALGQADLLALQSAVGPVSPGSYWSVLCRRPFPPLFPRRPKANARNIKQVRQHQRSIRHGRRALRRFPSGGPGARRRTARSRRLGPHGHQSLHQRP